MDNPSNMKEYVKDFDVKGHCKVELTDVNTGEIKMVERNNTISIQHKAYLKMLSCMNFLVGPKSSFPNDTKSYMASGENLFKFLVMSDNTEPMTEETILFKGNTVGYADPEATYSGIDPLKGTINLHECKWEQDKIVLVFDFPTHAGNGIIGTVGFKTLSDFSINSAQGIVHNLAFSFDGISYYESNKYCYDYSTNKLIVETANKDVYEVDISTMSYNKIGTDKYDRGFDKTFTCINKKTYFIVAGKLVEYDLVTKIERTGTQDLPASSWYTRSSIYFRNGELYLNYDGKTSKVNMNTLNVVEQKNYTNSIVDETATYCPIDDYVYSNFGKKIKFTTLYQDKTADGLADFEDVPQVNFKGGYIYFPIYKLSGGVCCFPGYKQGDFIPSGCNKRDGYNDVYAYSFLKLTDYPANWATACVLPTPVEKNQTQTMKVTYTFSYDDLFKKGV